MLCYSGTARRWPGIPAEVGVSVAVSGKFRKTTRGERVGITASAKPWPPLFLLPYLVVDRRRERGRGDKEGAYGEGRARANEIDS